MARAMTQRVKRASIVMGAVAVASMVALSFEVDEEHDGLANDSGSTTNAISPIEAS